MENFNMAKTNNLAIPGGGPDPLSPPSGSAHEQHKCIESLYCMNIEHISCPCPEKTNRTEVNQWNQYKATNTNMSQIAVFNVHAASCSQTVICFQLLLIDFAYMNVGCSQSCWFLLVRCVSSCFDRCVSSCLPTCYQVHCRALSLHKAFISSIYLSGNNMPHIVPSCSFTSIHSQLLFIDVLISPVLVVLSCVSMDMIMLISACQNL